jgi:hypothetical protein
MESTPKNSQPDNQERPSTHEQRVEAFKVWQEGGKEALGKLLLKNQAAYKKAKAERSKA